MLESIHVVVERVERSSKRAALVINLRSRSGTASVETAKRQLERRGIGVDHVYLVGSGRGIARAVSSAVRAGAHTIVVGGGDGTLSAAVDVLADQTDVVVGLLPLGTSNEVARALGVPLDLQGACDVIANGRVEVVDLARANSDYFVHTALVGYLAHVNFATPLWLKRRVGKIAHVFSLLTSTREIKPFRASVTAGDVRWENETILVVVGNGRLHSPGRILLPASARRESGLTVYAPRDLRWSTIVRLIVGWLVTRRPQPSLLLSAAADHVTVVTDPPQLVDLDGEISRSTPVNFHLARRALRILVPQNEVTARSPSYPPRSTD